MSLRLLPVEGSLAAIEQTLGSCGVTIMEMRVRATGSKERVWMKLGNVPSQSAGRIIARLRALEGVQDVAYTAALPPTPGGDDEDNGPNESHMPAEDS